MRFFASLLLLTLYAAPVFARTPTVQVNEQLINSLGQAPTVPGQYRAMTDAYNPRLATRRVAKPTLTSTTLAPPPLKKPRSQWNQQLIATGSGAGNTQKFQTKTGVQGLSFSRATNAAMLPARPVIGGYGWNDLDPRTRGMGVMTPVVAPAVMASIRFDGKDTDLTRAARGQLQPVAKTLQTQNAAAELLGYATPDKYSGDDAKRVALSRIISVRDHLIGLGVPGNQLGVKPIGIAPDGPKERVDIVKR